MRHNLDYSLLSVGVNRTPDAPLLRQAELDARKVAITMCSGLGPVDRARAGLLLGRRATKRGLDRALEREAARAPSYFAFYFGGHGNRAGISLADGLYPFSQLRYRLAQIGARASVVMVNSCEAGGFIDEGVISGLGDAASLSAAWGAQLLAAVPGTRVFMASARNASTYELPEIGGIFAHALTTSMQAPAAGDLHVDGTEFVSDRLLFSRTGRIMEQFGLRPVGYGNFGGFPMVLAHRHPVGDTEIADIEPAAGIGLEVSVRLRDRQFLATRIVATATDAFGCQIAAQNAIAVPQEPDAVFTAMFAAEALSAGCQQQLLHYGRCRVAWDITIVDGHGRSLDRFRHVADYHG